MKRVSLWLSLGMLVLVAGMVTGCKDVERFTERMKLTEAQALEVKPLLEQYLEDQEKLFTSMRPKMPQGGQGGIPGGGMSMEGGRPGAGGPGSGRTPSMANFKAKREEMEKRFADNDQSAAFELGKILEPAPIAEFRIFAKEYRMEKMKDMMSQSSGPGGGPGGGMGGGPGGMGGMGGM